MTTTSTCQPTGCTIWDGAPEEELETLCCLPIVETFADLRTLPTDLGYFPSRVSLRGHTTPGDGGGGEFNILTGAAPGTYVDDNGVVAEFVGGDGSAAAVREIDDFVSSAMWGCPTDGSDGITQLEAMRDYVAARSYKMDESATGSFGVVVAPPRMIISDGKVGLSREFRVNGGMSLECARGAELIALTNGMTMIASTTPDENFDDYGHYSSKSLCMRDLILNGNGLASAGILLNTVAAGSEVHNPRIYNVTGLRVDGVSATTTAGSNLLSVPDSSIYRVLDVIFLSVQEFPYVVQEIIDAGTIRLNYNVQVSGSATVQQMAVAFQTAMDQQTNIYNVDIRFNDVGMFLGVNSHETDPKRTTDITFTGGICTHNNRALISSDAHGSRFLGTTFQMSQKNSEILLHRSRGIVFFDAWIEPADYGVSIANGLQAIPLIRIDMSGYGAQFFGMRWSHNPSSGCSEEGQPDGCNWRRLMDNEGPGTAIFGISTNLNELTVNPADPDDSAWIAQRPFGDVVMTWESGQLSLDLPWQFIVAADTDGVVTPSPSGYPGGAFPINARVILQRQGGELRAGQEYLHSIDASGLGTDTPFRLFSNQDYDSVSGSYSNYRIGIRSNGIYIGDGTGTPMKIIGRRISTYTSPTGTPSRAVAWDTESVEVAQLSRFVYAMYLDLKQHGLWNES